MKRDPELIRALLLKLEALPLRSGAIAHIRADDDEVAIEGYDPDQIDYHLRQLQGAGFLDDGGLHPMRGIGFRSLTWQGHDFVDTVRDPEIWSKTKQGADAIRGWSIDTLKEIAKGIIKKQVEEYSGVKIG